MTLPCLVMECVDSVAKVVNNIICPTVQTFFVTHFLEFNNIDTEYCGKADVVHVFACIELGEEIVHGPGSAILN